MNYKHFDILVENMSDEQADALRDSILKVVESFDKKAAIEINDTLDEEILSELDEYWESKFSGTNSSFDIFGDDFEFEEPD